MQRCCCVNECATDIGAKWAEQKPLKKQMMRNHEKKKNKTQQQQPSWNSCNAKWVSYGATVGHLVVYLIVIAQWDRMPDQGQFVFLASSHSMWRIFLSFLLFFLHSVIISCPSFWRVCAYAFGTCHLCLCCLVITFKYFLQWNRPSWFSFSAAQHSTIAIDSTFSLCMMIIDYKLTNQPTDRSISTDEQMRLKDMVCVCVSVCSLCCYKSRTFLKSFFHPTWPFQSKPVNILILHHFFFVKSHTSLCVFLCFGSAHFCSLPFCF